MLQQGVLLEHFHTVFSGEAPFHPGGSGGTQEENGDRGAAEEEGGFLSSSRVHLWRAGAVRVRAGDLAPGVHAVSSEDRAVKGPCLVGVSLQGSAGVRMALLPEVAGEGWPSGRRGYGRGAGLCKVKLRP